MAFQRTFQLRAFQLTGGVWDVQCGVDMRQGCMLAAPLQSCSLYRLDARISTSRVLCISSILTAHARCLYAAELSQLHHSCSAVNSANSLGTLCVTQPLHQSSGASMKRVR